jgi:fatty acyl-CoA reductase
MSEISEFLKNQTIFITGVTGFLGKVMLWKALKEAGEGVKIYAMVRPSKDASPQKRLEDLYSAPIFDELLAAKPQLKERVIAIPGDITKDCFDMSVEDQQILENEVTVIIHSAATTKFTEKLKLAVEMNTLAVSRMLSIAKRCKKIGFSGSNLHVLCCG